MALNLLITAGPTREPVDPVRFLSNRSSGKMGYALARAAVAKGFAVTLISGPVALTPPDGLAGFVSVTTAAEMAQAVKSRFPLMDAAILCAAVADYTPKTVASQKIKKADGGLTLELVRTEDILAALGKMKTSAQKLIGFAAETQDLEQNAMGKLTRKNLDWIAANRVDLPNLGFQSEQNAITLLGADGSRIEFPAEEKTLLAARLLDAVFN